MQSTSNLTKYARHRYGEPPAAGIDIGECVEASSPNCRTGHSTELLPAGRNLRTVGPELLDSRQARLVRLYSGARYVQAMSAALIPMSTREGDDLIEWVRDLVNAIYLVKPHERTDRIP